MLAPWPAQLFPVHPCLAQVFWWLQATLWPPKPSTARNSKCCILTHISNILSIAIIKTTQYSTHHLPRTETCNYKIGSEWHLVKIFIQKLYTFPLKKWRRALSKITPASYLRWFILIYCFYLSKGSVKFSFRMSGERGCVCYTITWLNS